MAFEEKTALYPWLGTLTRVMDVGILIVSGSQELEFASDKAVRVARFSPKMAPVARRKFRGGRVQVRSVCDDEALTLVVEAAKGNRQVKPGSILRRASFARRT